MFRSGSAMGIIRSMLLTSESSAVESFDPRGTFEDALGGDGGDMIFTASAIGASATTDATGRLTVACFANGVAVVDGFSDDSWECATRMPSGTTMAPNTAHNETVASTRRRFV